MELIFFNRTDFKIKGYAFATLKSSIILDNVVPQVSTFELNESKINATIGDYVVLKNSKFNYIGIINSIDLNSKTKQITIKTSDFLSILDWKVKLTSFTGNISLYLSDLIQSTFIDCSDQKQRIPFLAINRDGDEVNGTLAYEEDTIGTISSLLKNLNKTYSIGVKYKLNKVQGRIKGIILTISKCSRGRILKYNLPMISNLKIVDNNTQIINELVFYPKDENVVHREVRCFYLLNDGTISEDVNDPKRFNTISMDAKFYGDNDYETLLTTAHNEMLTSELEHSISFDYLIDNEIAKLFDELNVGDFVSFIGENKTYNTMITKLVINGDLKTANVTLGEYRVSLTEKLKLLFNRGGR